MVDFGQRLKELRLNAGLTQQQLADRLWLTKATVCYYEQSFRCPSPDMIIKLAGIFHVSADYLLGIDDKRQTLDVTDLTDEEISVLQKTIDIFRKKA